MYRLFTCLLCLFAVATTSLVAIAAEPKSTSAPDAKIRALLVTGGCCHDYQNQKRIISEALSSRIDAIDWTILEYGSKREVKPDVYRRGDWIQGFDIVEEVWPTTTVLAKVHSDETGKDEPVIWTNEYQGVRVFGISLGHHNETMESPQWQEIVAAGFRWSLQQ